MENNSLLKYPLSYDKKIPYFHNFMERYAPSGYMHRRNKLIYFTLYLEKNYGVSILEANINHMLKFFREDINARNIQRDGKNKWRHVLNGYFEYVKEIKEKLEGSPFINPVPSIHLFDFEEKELSIEELEKEGELLSYLVVEKILNYLYFTRKRLFILVSLLLYSGARISEVSRIKLENIDFEERYFFTKIKSKKTLNRYGIYFFPRFFIEFLQEWIRDLKIEFENPKYLFQYKNTHINPKTPRKHLRSVKNELGLTCKMNPHAFRDFINTIRFDTKMKEKYRFLLLNQTPPNVNVKNYLKKYQLRKELLKKYDEFFPFPEFKPKLNLM